MIGFALRPERDDDRAFLRDLYRELRASEPASALMPREIWSAMIDQQFESQYGHYRGAYHDAEFWIVEQDGRPIGRLYVDDGPLGIRVLDIVLLPQSRGRGIGSRLLTQVLDRARTKGCSVFLQVAAGNPARELYRRLGFRDVIDDGPFVSMRWDPGR